MSWVNDSPGVANIYQVYTVEWDMGVGLGTFFVETFQTCLKTDPTCEVVSSLSQDRETSSVLRENLSPPDPRPELRR